jgi:hypothetical protein
MQRLSVLLLAALLVFGAGCGRDAVDAKRFIVLGVDGMDPGFLERHWDALPNLAALGRQGGFRRLGTTIPPQSPVAWSTFITGLDPGGHGVFDFVHRNPRTMQPFSSMAATEEPGPQPFDRPLSAAPFIRTYPAVASGYGVLAIAGGSRRTGDNHTDPEQLPSARKQGAIASGHGHTGPAGRIRYLYFLYG